MNFFDTKKFLMRREIVKRFLETDPSKQNNECRENNLSTYLSREGNERTRGTHVEHLSRNHWK